MFEFATPDAPHVAETGGKEQPTADHTEGPKTKKKVTFDPAILSDAGDHGSQSNSYEITPLSADSEEKEEEKEKEKGVILWPVIIEHICNRKQLYLIILAIILVAVILLSILIAALGGEAAPEGWQCSDEESLNWPDGATDTTFRHAIGDSAQQLPFVTCTDREVLASQLTLARLDENGTYGASRDGKMTLADRSLVLVTEPEDLEMEGSEWRVRVTYAPDAQTTYHIYAVIKLQHPCSFAQFQDNSGLSR